MEFKRLFLAVVATAGLLTADVYAERLVILHTNDTHSQIDPNDYDRGGILRRKVLIDSVRAVEPNVLLVDAGDAVQGTLYFSLFGGEVERKMMNKLGYDLQILGNHEFDNGLEALAREWSRLDARLLASNYDLTDTPLDGLTSTYALYTYGDRTIGFIAINIDPAGMIDAKKSVGVKYLDGIEVANRLAAYLKQEEGADYVVALTHIGYMGQQGYSDLDLVAASHDIDLVIGGHSHTCIDPSDPASVDAWYFNADGDAVLMAQTGGRGVNLGEITIDLPTLSTSSRIIPITSRLDPYIDPEAEAILLPYRHAIDSIQSIVIGDNRELLDPDTPGLVNFVSDFVYDRGRALSPDGRVDLAIMNRGGIRCPLPAGPITKGRIMMMLPFDNRIQLLDITGADLLETFGVIAGRGSDGVSSGVSMVIDTEENRCISVTIDGKPIDPQRIYRLATIDYLADGGDYMTPLTRARRVATSDQILYDELIDYFSDGPMKGKTLVGDERQRFTFEHPEE